MKCLSKSISAFLLATLALANASAGNVTATAARSAASNFFKQHLATSAGSLKAPSSSAFKLVHAEPSSKEAGVNDYYVFNIDGGGFVIIAGEDRATQVLGYSDKGSINFNNLPLPLKDLLNSYKNEIEFLQTYKGNDLIIMDSPTLKASASVDPLIKTTWGQEMPYYLQCPIYQGEYCAVGCVATAMAQVMNYWQYPTSFPSMNGFNSRYTGQSIPAIPATTVDYSLMLDSYCHWDWDNSQLIQDVYTDAQAQEVAKLGRYCGQAVQMGYSPDGSGAYTSNQLSAMKSFGYSNARLYSKGSSGWWGGYSTTQWESMIKTELDAGRPILYSANDPNSGGHAFICDGYNSEGLFHFNLGWYGTCDGWYSTTALKMVHRDGDELNFSSGHEMITGLEAPYYCIIDADNVNADNNLLILGESINAEAQNVTFRTSYNSLNLLFSLTDAENNRVATADAISINKSSFEQGSTVASTITLPADLAPGTYDLALDYYTTSATALNRITSGDGKLVVVGHVAKYNAPFDVDDISILINYVLGKTPHQGVAVDVEDVSILINYILGKN